MRENLHCGGGFHNTLYNIRVPEAVIYARVSKMSKSISIDDQERECRETCARNDWPVRQVFRDDGISASRYGATRPAWVALKDYLDPGNILVVWEASRAGRDLEEYVALRSICVEREVRLSYSGRLMDLSKGDDRFISGLDALVAERESEIIRERVLRGRRSAAADGRPTYRAPWGYRRRVDPVTGIAIPGAWEFDPEEVPRVREAVRRYLRGDSQGSILRWLQEGGGTAPRTATGLQRALTRPSISGLRVHQGKVVREGTWEPIISEEVRQQLVDHINGMKRVYGHVSPPGPEPRTLLGGIARCGVCDAPLDTKRYRKGAAAYGCPEGHLVRKAEPIDRLVEDELLELATSIDPSKYNSDDPAVAEASREMAKIESELDDWIAAAGRREISRVAFVKIEKDLRARLEDLRPRAIAKARFQNVNFEQLAERWSDATIRQKRDAVRALLSVVIQPRRHDQKGKLPCSRCGKTPRYARTLCHNCYMYLWRRGEPLPDGRRSHADGVIVTPLFEGNAK